MNVQTILLVEDEEDIQQLVSFNLVKAGYRVLCTESGEQGLGLLEEETIDLILLDLMLPGMGGLEFCRLVRGRQGYNHIPIIMLTAKGEEADIIAGLNNGADDYITKPFSQKILMARIAAILRRQAEIPAAEEAEMNVLRIHNICLDLDRHTVTIDGQPVNLTVTEFSILRVLAAKPGRVFTRQQIIDHIRGYEFTVTERNVDVQVFGLRKKLKSAKDLVETVRGIGYRFKDVT